MKNTKVQRRNLAQRYTWAARMWLVLSAFLWEDAPSSDGW
jgi:hypothetical protein